MIRVDSPRPEVLMPSDARLFEIAYVAPEANDNPSDYIYKVSTTDNPRVFTQILPFFSEALKVYRSLSLENSSLVIEDFDVLFSYADANKHFNETNGAPRLHRDPKPQIAVANFSPTEFLTGTATDLPEPEPRNQIERFELHLGEPISLVTDEVLLEHGLNFETPMANMFYGFRTASYHRSPLNVTGTDEARLFIAANLTSGSVK